MNRNEAASIYRRFRSKFAQVAEKVCYEYPGGANHEFQVKCQDWLDDKARVIRVHATPAQWAEAAEAVYYNFVKSYGVRTSLDGGYSDWMREQEDCDYRCSAPASSSWWRLGAPYWPTRRG